MTRPSPDQATRDAFDASLREAAQGSTYDPVSLDEIEVMRQEIAELDSETLEVLVRRLEWLTKARPKQLPPSEYLVWLLLAGRGTGKTRSGAEDIWWPAWREPQRVAVIGPTLADVRKTCFEGESGLTAVIPQGLIRAYNRTNCEMWLTNDSYFVGYSSEEPERLRGPQHHRAWCDELAAWKYIEDTWDMRMFGLRLGEHPNVVVTTTPKPVGLVRKLIADASPDRPLSLRTIVSRESTFANERNLPASYIEQLRDKYEGTRLGRQELNAEILDDNPYALWSMKLLDACRWPTPREKHPLPTDLLQTFVAVDPPVTSGEDADECGIVAGSRYVDPASGRDHFLITDDRSMEQANPQAWATKAVGLFYEREADAIIAEVNNGGEMVAAVIHAVDANVPVLSVSATRGKVRRAQPVAALYEQLRVHHVGHFDKLEDQMCDFTTDFDKEVMGYSPDRVDALVWLLTGLLGEDFGYNMLGAVG
jgi:phage terminase large subunit-like protein